MSQGDAKNDDAARQPEDAELKAMRRILRIFQEMPDEARARVMCYVERRIRESAQVAAMRV